MRPPERRDERGSITPFVVIVSLAIILLAGLVIDGGRQLNAKGRAIAYAQEAARAGAQAINVDDPDLDLVNSQALQAASTYCSQARAADAELVQCTASIETVQDARGSYKAVTVTARVQAPTILLNMIGWGTLDADGTALARPVSGISGPDSGKVSTVGPPSLAPPSAAQPTENAPSAPPTAEVTPCTPRDEDDDEPGKGKGDDDKPGDDKPKPGDDDKPETCKTPEVPDR